MSTVTLTWVDPTTRVGGAPLAPSEIASATIFDDISDGNGPVQIGAVTGAITTFTTGTLSGGTHNFTVEVTDTTVPGHVSAMSNIFTVVIPIVLADPSPPTGLTGVVDADVVTIPVPPPAITATPGATLAAGNVLTWTAGVVSNPLSTIAGYNIIRSDAPTVNINGTTLISGLTFTDTVGLVASTAYTYMVQAVDNSVPPVMSAFSAPSAPITTAAA